MANIFVGSVHTLIRNLFLGLDGIVYGFINHVYWLFSMLTEVSIFSQDQIEAFAGRIYVLISIIMLFKLGFSFITYIVNPDSFTDKQKGGTALLKNIAIAIILLASVPTIFNEAMHLQQLIFKNNVIDKILLGNTVQVEDSYVNENGENVQVEQSNALSMYAFMAFFQPNYLISECNTYEGIVISDSCVNKLNELDKTKHNPGSAYKQAIETYNLDFITATDIANTKGKVSSSNSDAFYVSDESYLFEYKYGLSTLVGVFIVWILLGFCLDLAIRVVKLGFLQIIAPIPIILSITPGQKNNPLSNWGKECFSTWLSLFTRVLVISFALTTIQLINSGGGIISFVTGGSNNYAMVTVFVMLGILLFAKEFPKLLEDILGLKGTGKMTFNPLKKVGTAPLLGGAVAAGATLAGAGALALGRGAWGTAKAGLAGTWSAVRGRGFNDGFGKHFGDTGDRMVSRGLAGLSSAKDKITSAGWGGTDKLGGSMHKAYGENYSPRKEMRHNDDLNKRGKKYDDNLDHDTVEAAKNKLKAGDSLKPEEKNAVIDAYKKAYGGKHDRYATAEANLDMAKSKQAYLKNAVAHLERAAASNPGDDVIRKQLEAAQKGLSDADKQVTGFETEIKGLEKIDKSGAEISAAMKVYNARKKSGEMKIDASLSEEKIRSSSSNSVATQNQQLADTIANAVKQGVASAMGTNNQSPNNSTTILDQNGNPIRTVSRSNDAPYQPGIYSQGLSGQTPSPQSTPSPQQPQRQNPGTVSSRGFGPGNNNQ